MRNSLNAHSAARAILGKLVLLASVCLSAQAQFAPYAMLWYNDNTKGDIITVRMRAPLTTSYTYFAALSWNNGAEGQGYCGIQDGGSGRRNYIFSLWDPSKVSGVPTAVYADTRGAVSRFGGEGTGIHYLNFGMPWEAKQEYQFLARAWDDGKHTQFGLWSLDVSASRWTHHATYDFPEASVRFSTSTVSFLEDWMGTAGNARRMEVYDGWKRTIPGRWIPFDSAYFAMSRTQQRSGAYYNAFDAGISKSAYYMQTGGSTTPGTDSTATIKLAATGSGPTLPAGQSRTAAARLDSRTGQVTVAWESDPRLTPQFSYKVELFATLDLRDMPAAAQTAIAPHIRSAVLATGGTQDPSAWAVRLTTADVLDQESDPLLLPVIGPQTAKPAGRLSTTPAALDFRYSTGGDAPAARAVQVSNSEGVPSYRVAAVDGRWIGVSPGVVAGTLIVAVSPAGLAVGSYSGSITLASDSTFNLARVPVTLTVLPQGPTIAAVMNSATARPEAQSGAWISIYGSRLSRTTRSWTAADIAGGRLPASLDGVSVTVNGKAAAVRYVSPAQVDVQAPDGIAVGNAAVKLTGPDGSASGSVSLKAVSPGFFLMLGKYVAAVHTDGAYVAPVGAFGAGVASRPARPGETILLFGSGFGPTAPAIPAGIVPAEAAVLADPSQLKVRVGGTNADITYAGMVGAGLYQVNVTVPVVPSGDSGVVAEIGGESSPSGVVLSIQN